MGSAFEIDTAMGTTNNKEEEKIDEDELSPIEQVRLTVLNTDDPTLPVWTFRMWTLGLVSCCLLSFLNQFFSYRTQPLVITQITVQIASLPVGKFMASVLPHTKFRLPGCGSRQFSLNPGPFNMKEHVLVTIFASAGCAFGNGPAYAVGIVDIIKAFYHRHISFVAGWALHEKEDTKGMSRGKFFLIVFICSFCWYTFPGYIFPTLTTISWVCWIFKHSVTAQQLGSGMQGLGLGAFALDWAAVSAFLFSPLISPFFAIVNIFFGYFLIIYIVMPIAYWGFDLYSAKKFPIFSSQLFTSAGQQYDINSIVNNKFELDIPSYDKEGRVNLSMFFALTYGFGFATIAATLTHVGLFYGKEIYQRYRAASKNKIDIHTKLMRRYEDIPQWWFHVLLMTCLAVSFALCIGMKSQVQMPWWGLLLGSALAFAFTLPISIITATTNQTPGLNIITEYLMGLIYPGKPVANVCFKVYGYMSMAQAVSFLNDFKLGHYMKIPPRSMFLVQFLGTMIAGTINIGVAWWLLGSINNICNIDLLPPNSPWTCPNDRVFFDASVIWGLVGPRRIFGVDGNYGALNWFFLGGALGPVFVWLLHKAFPKQAWIPLINLPVILGATAYMPPATPMNYNVWIFVGTIFNFFVFRYRKQWWQRYNYVLSAGLDAGVAFMGVLIYFTLTMENKSITWWGTGGEHCDLASCPTAKGIVVDGCPVYS
ncbi:hypothetical protein NE237_022474 [Protea cynaroides]|uniref:Oligopeptide transporter 4 n=1 Tax=Protea cynaroides TaxID=273540 RepID=A0A9Q0HB20_9MAGN|nr:hypothetical protein NE237_022474 [Protea cynaroides]